jgi:transforming growth factor-beta-induced protein
VVAADRIKTLAKEKAYIKTDNGVQIGNDMNGYANIIATDIDASNGVIHVLDKVIIPTKLDMHPTILDIAASNDDFSILVKAVQFVGLESKLAGKNKKYITAFAPTNQAFIDLLTELGISADDLFQESNKDLIRTIPLYHLTDGSLYAADVVSAGRLKMKAYEYAYIRTDKYAQIGNAKYGFANIVGADIKASNGVVHVLDKVIIPKKIDLGSDKPTILEIAAGSPDFTILVKAVEFTNIADVLAGEKKLTAFAPTNEAFIKLLAKLNLTAEELFVKENKQLIKKILYYHLVKHEYYAEDVVYSDKLKTLAWQYAYIRTDKGPQIGNEKFGFANITGLDIMASNGVVHVLDEVILPPDLEL